MFFNAHVTLYDKRINDCFIAIQKEGINVKLDAAGFMDVLKEISKQTNNKRKIDFQIKHRIKQDEIISKITHKYLESLGWKYEEAKTLLGKLESIENAMFFVQTFKMLVESQVFN